jgi:dihydroorotase
LEAATGGESKFFLGTDSAPHSQAAKENACGCAGMFTAHAAIELYATAFEQAGALDKLEAFASFHGADFYRLPRNRDTVTLNKENWLVPQQYEFAGENLIPLYANAVLSWRMA